jgi:hypothetical protein
MSARLCGLLPYRPQFHFLNNDEFSELPTIARGPNLVRAALELEERQKLIREQIKRIAKIANRK